MIIDIKGTIPKHLPLQTYRNNYNSRDEDSSIFKSQIQKQNYPCTMASDPPDHHITTHRGLPITPKPFPPLAERWVWLMRTSLAQAAPLPSRCPAHAPAPAHYKKQHMAGSPAAAPLALLTRSPAVEAGCMLSCWDRRGVIRK